MIRAQQQLGISGRFGSVFRLTRRAGDGTVGRSQLDDTPVTAGMEASALFRYAILP